MNWQTVLRNWKTTIFGILAFLASVPAFVTAAQEWAANQPVNWRAVLVSVAFTAVGAGLACSKDATTHSTLSEVRASTIQADVAADKASDAKAVDIKI